MHPRESNESENEFNAEKKPDTIIKLSNSENIFLALEELEKLLDSNGKPSLIIKTSQIMNLSQVERVYSILLNLLYQINIIYFN